MRKMVENVRYFCMGHKRNLHMDQRSYDESSATATATTENEIASSNISAGCRMMMMHNNARMAVPIRSHKIDGDLLLCAHRRAYHTSVGEMCICLWRQFCLWSFFYLSQAKNIHHAIECDSLHSHTKEWKSLFPWHWQKRFKTEQKIRKQWKILISSGLAAAIFPILFRLGSPGLIIQHMCRRRVKYLFIFVILDATIKFTYG